MITGFYTTTFTVKRMVWASSKATLVEQGDFEGHIQQAQLEDMARLANGYTLTHIVWCDPDEDVEIGDTLETDDDTYSVRAIYDRNIGGNAHKELHIEKDK